MRSTDIIGKKFLVIAEREDGDTVVATFVDEVEAEHYAKRLEEGTSRDPSAEGAAGRATGYLVRPS